MCLFRVHHTPRGAGSRQRTKLDGDEPRRRGVLFFRKGRQMDFVALIAAVLAVLGWFLAVWQWIDAAAWREQAERSEKELLRVQHQLGKCRDELTRWGNHCGCGRDA
jgi:hypothetical protein